MEGKENQTDQPRALEETGNDSPLKKALRKAGGRHIAAGMRQVDKGLVRKITAAIAVESPDDVPMIVVSTASSLSSEKVEDEQNNLQK